MKNNTVSQIESPGRRAAAYWFADGLAEIAFGLVFFAYGVLGMAWEVHFRNWWMGGAILVSFIAVLILFCKDLQILDYLKSRLTYSRTGYARPPKYPEPGQDILVDLLMKVQRLDEPLSLRTARANDENVTSFKFKTAGLFLVAFMVAQAAPQRWSVAILMVAVAALLFALNHREARSYSVWSVTPVALLGLLSTAVDLPAGSRQFIPPLIGGGWLLAQGGWNLIRYLRNHPRSAAPERERL